MAVEGERVTLNIYDVSKGLARQLSATFLGKAIEAIWHTGIIVYGNEYYFGAGRSIQHSPVGSMPHGTPLAVVDLEVTHLTKDGFEMYLQEISQHYTAETYSMLSCNCNHFSNEVSQFLVGATIPEYILQLPNQILSSPMGALMLPMIQNLESTFICGAVPNPSTVNKSTTRQSDNELKGKEVGSKSSPNNGVATRDPLGDARNKVQDEIVKEFAAIMATGTMRVSEAVTLATMKVMQRLGQIA